MVEPIDLMVNLGQTITVAQVRQAEQQEPVHRQGFLAIKFEQEAHHKQEQIQKIEKPEHTMKVKEREREGERGGYYRRRKWKEKGKEEKEEVFKEKTLGCFIDLKG